MKRKEEMNERKTEHMVLNNKFKEFSDDELQEVTGGNFEDLWKKIKEMGEKVKKEDSNGPVNPIKPISL